LYCFCVFLYFIDFGRKLSNSKIRMKSAKSLLERFNSKSILNLRKEKSAKFVIFWKESRMSMSLYFNHNFLLEHVFEITRASRILLIHINRSLNIEETHKLWERIKGYSMRFSLVFLFLYYFLMMMISIQIMCN
jgi:hypothetical protein